MIAIRFIAFHSPCQYRGEDDPFPQRITEETGKDQFDCFLPGILLSLLRKVSSFIPIVMIIGSLIEFVLHPPLARCPAFDFSCHKQKGGEVFRFLLLLHLPLKQIGNFFQHGGRNAFVCNLRKPGFIQEGSDLNLGVQRSRRDILPDLVQILFP